MSLTAPLQLPISYLLVFHGSRDPRAAIAADALTQRFREKLQSIAQLQTTDEGLRQQRIQPLAGEADTEIEGHGDTRNSKQWSSSPRPLLFSSLHHSSLLAPTPPPLLATDRSVASSQNQVFVKSAFLECHPLSLHEQIEQFAAQIQATAITPLRQLVVLPVFLLQGVHVMEDIPAEVALAQPALGDDVQVKIASHLGSHPGLGRLIAKQMASFSVEAWVLIAHGSRRFAANQPIEVLAETLNAVAAYWSVSPGLEVRIQELSHSFSKIGILPFFLFNGGITDAIAQTLTNFSQKFSTLTFMLADPLEANPELVDLLVDLALNLEF